MFERTRRSRPDPLRTFTSSVHLVVLSTRRCSAGALFADHRDSGKSPHDQRLSLRSHVCGDIQSSFGTTVAATVDSGLIATSEGSRHENGNHAVPA